MKQLTVRGFDEGAGGAHPSPLEADGVSLNQAALKLLRKGAGLTDPTRKADTVGSSLDHLIGKWTDEEAVEMERALEEFEIVDEADWR